jgi:tetratricopeptide (TPR) repeat protein
MRSILAVSVASLVLCLSSVAHAAGGGGGGMVPALADPDFVTAKNLIDKRNYRDAFPLLQRVVTKDPNNADAYVLMGYAVRKSGDANASLQFYNQALSLDPKHIGAHEYIGEAYLMLDRPQEAEQHLARLNSICLFGCTEYKMLKTAVANYKAGQKPTN